MWFKYFNKEDWNLRMWKWYNLKMDANVYGTSRNQYLARWQALLFKVFRGEGVLRFVISVAYISGALIYLDLTKEKRAISAHKQELEEQAEAEREKERYLREQKLNRYMKPTMLLSSMDAFMNHVTNSSAINDALEYSSNETAALLQDDHSKGLDSWLPKRDRYLIQYAKGGDKQDHH